MASGAAHLKQEIRRRVQGALSAVSESRWREGSDAACANVIGLEEFKRAKRVMLYAPMAREVDVSRIALECQRLGKSVWLPRVDWDAKTMAAAAAPKWNVADLVPGQHGLREPSPTAEVAEVGTLDLVVVPGVAFDARGGRLGRGQGFYDKFLGQRDLRAAKIGIAIEEQIVDEVPMEEWDIRLDRVVTDAC